MGTPPALDEEHALADGTRMRLRFIRPDDAAELKRGFDRLSPASRYRRFLGAVGHLSDATLRYLTDVDGRDHVAIVATRARPDGSEEGLGVARFIRVADEPTVAEAAITVADDMQRRGIGRHLGVALAAAARARGIGHFRGEILANNESVRQLLVEAGATLRTSDEDRVVFDIALADVPSTVPGERAIANVLAAAATWLVELVRPPR